MSSLSTYRKKRNFGITSEPKGAIARTGKKLSFVIQKHAASRLHYDFRLELDGTLKSWAVPKGPSLDPKVRRMAVHVEDHPLSYASFEGVIPKGQYGAGTVIVWDRGTWTPVEDPREGYKKGKLKFDLDGEKLRGRWNLVRVRGKENERQEPWLLIKETDDEAKPAAEYDVVEELPNSVNKTMKKKTTKLPLTFSPQLATLVDDPPKGDGWVYEIKYDGYRIVARIEDGDVRLFTRNGNDWTSKLTTLRDDLARTGIESAWLDGEIVVLGAGGVPDFQELQRAFDGRDTRKIAYYVFDAPYLAGQDLRRVPLVERRELLRAAMKKSKAEHVLFSEHVEGDGKELLAGACGKGLEGLIGKRADSPYTSTRSTAWVKLKCTKRQEFIVAGFTDPKGGRTGFGSLLLAINDAKGELQYAGNVGTGFDDETLRTLKAKLTALAVEKSPFAVPPKGVKGHWVKPKLVAEVAFTEWTGDGRIRHPVFHGLRTDKDPQAITREKALHDVPKKAAARASGEAKKTEVVAGIKVSNADRLIDKASGARKIDLVRYYDGIADWILPHLVGRPVSLVRAPQGLERAHFFQKHNDTAVIPDIKELPRSLWPEHPPMIEIATRKALVGAAQMNTIELHTWNSTTKAIDKPDRVIFDLDPGEGISWETLKEATQITHQMLEVLELESFLKTSGGKGLHVVVRLTPKEGYDAVKDFSQAVVVHLARTFPKLFVAKSGAKNRVGLIFVDYLRNGRGATTATAFSARARPGLGVSVPVTWSELAGLESAAQWNIFNVHDRLEKLKGDPWKDYGKVRQTTTAAWKRLEKAK